MSIMTIPQGIVTKIATATTKKILRNLSRDIQFFITEVPTGNAAPSVATMSTDAYLLFQENSITEDLEYDDEVDIYIFCPQGNGRLRIDENSSNNMMLVDETGVGYGIKHINNKPRVSAMPYLYDIAEDNVSGHVPFSKIGFAPSLAANANTDVWSYSATQPVYLFPTAAMGMEVVCQDNTADKGTSIKDGTSTGGSLTELIDTGKDFTASTAVAVGDYVILEKAGASPEYGYVTKVEVNKLTCAGAQAVEIVFLDGAYAEQREIVILNGTGVVPTVKLTLFRINSFRVITAGANKIPTGFITLRHIDNTPVYSYITAGFNRARNAMYTVPAGKTLYVTELAGGYATTGNANKEYARITTRANIDPTSKFKTDGLFYPFTDMLTQNNTVIIPLNMPTSLTQKTDIKLSVIASATGAVITTLRGWIETL